MLVKKAIALEIGVVVQDMLKLSDETDLESLNNGMEIIVEAFQDELMPVAAQLTARLVSIIVLSLSLFLSLVSATRICVSQEKALVPMNARTIRSRIWSTCLTRKTTRPTLLWGLVRQFGL